MSWISSNSSYRSLTIAFGAAFFFLFGSSLLRAQEAPAGPQTPPPEHRVTHMSSPGEGEAPPALPVDEIIKRISAKEDEYDRARTTYTFRRTVRIQEFDPDGNPDGEYVLVTQQSRNPDGELFDKVVQRPQSTLRRMHLISDDVEALDRFPSYPLTTSQLSQYNLKYVGKEKVDEIDCYIFQVRPKLIQRTRPLFDGVIWIDDKYIEVVKTYGKWVTDLGGVSTPALPFTLFETYREYIDGKFWFPTYARSDETMHLDSSEFPIRVTIRWSDFKKVGAPASTSQAPDAPNAAPANAPAATPKPSP